MAVSKIAVTIDESTLLMLDRLVKEKKFANRSRAIQEALEEKIQKMEKNRLAEACEFLDIYEERDLAEEGFAAELQQWPEY